MMNNILIFATISVLALSVFSIGVSMPVLAQENNTMSGVETNPEDSVQPEMEINGTSMVANGTNATTTTTGPANATFG
jgi:cell division protein FtsX